jgi:RecA-family ATPase
VIFHGGEPVGVTEQDQRLRRLGIYTPQTLRKAVARDAKKPFLVEGLLRMRSVNLLVGDSGLGKTPLAIQIGICIAAGIPLFGHRVQQGRVLYCDAESGRAEFCETLQVISRFLGLQDAPPDFHVWSPNWEIERSEQKSWWSPGMRLKEIVDEVSPIFVVADAFRTFWPTAEVKNSDAAEMQPR